MLLDVEAIQQQGEKLSHVHADLVEKLKDGVYNADDLLDKVLTQAEQQQLRDCQQLLGSFSSLVSTIRNPMNSYVIMEIRERLDEISNDAVKFGSMFDYKRERRIREISCSHVN